MQHLQKKKYSFNADKDSKLLRERGIGFEKIIYAIANGGIIDIKAHPNQERYPSQELIYVHV